MMRIVFLIGFLFCVGGVFAQKVNFAFGPEMKEDKGLDFWGHLHHDASGHYVLWTENDGSGFTFRDKKPPLLQKYDHKFKLLFSRELVVKEEDISFGNCFYALDKFLLCTHQYEARDKTLRLQATPITMDGRIGKTTRLAQIQWRSKDDEPQEVDWKMSEDTTKLMVATYADDDDNDVKTQVSVIVHDHKLQKLWEKVFTLPYSQKQFGFKNWTVANDGRVYLLAKIYDENNNKESKREDGKRSPAYKMVVFRLDAESTVPYQIQLQLGEKYATDVTFKLDAAGDLSCAGFYSNDRRGVIQGVFFSRISGQDGKMLTTNHKEFTPSDLALFDTDKDKSGDEGLDRTFQFNQIILRDDGGAVVTAEQAYFIIRRYLNGNYWVTRTTYVNNEICVTSISPTGEIEWVRTIPKRQIMEETPVFNGYTMMVSGSNLYFLYNDDVDNLKKPLNVPAKRISSFNDAVATIVTINVDGQMARDLAFKLKDDTNKGLVVARHCKQTGPEELFFLTTRYQLLSRPRLVMGSLRVED